MNPLLIEIDAPAGGTEKVPRQRKQSFDPKPDQVDRVKFPITGTEAGEIAAKKLAEKISGEFNEWIHYSVDQNWVGHFAVSLVRFHRASDGSLNVQKGYFHGVYYVTHVNNVKLMHSTQFVEETKPYVWNEGAPEPNTDPAVLIRWFGSRLHYEDPRNDPRMIPILNALGWTKGPKGVWRLTQ